MKQSMRLDGARARSARQASRLTREALASRTGVSVSTLQRAERGDPIQSDIIELIADALGVGMEDLLPVSPGPKSLLKPGSELIERDAEWSTLQGALARARAGDLSLLLVSGEAGMGKTALLRQLYAESRSLGIRLLLGEGSQFEGSRFAFDPFVLAMREHLAAIEQVLHGDELAVLRAFLDRSDESGSEARRARLFDAVSSALRELGRRHCIVFAIDDLQWVDRDSLELFELLARRLLAVSAQSDAPCGILMIASTRPFDNRGKLVGEHDDVSENVVGTLRSVLERLDRLPLLQRVPLEGLSPRGVRTLIKQLGIERPAVQLVDTIHRGTGGNPLFVRHLVEDLRAGSELFEESGFVNASLAPEELRVGRFAGAIAARAERLEEACRDALAWAATLGPRVKVHRLAEVMQVPVAELRAHLDRGAEAGLLDKERTAYVFRHPLVRATFYQLSTATPDGIAEADGTTASTARLSPPERHRLIAERLNSLSPEDDVGEVAYHLLRAHDEGPPELTLRFCERQAELDFDACAWMASARHYTAAITAGERLRIDPRKAARLHVQAGLAYNYAFEAGAALLHYAASRELSRQVGDAPAEARALSRLVRFSDNTGDRGPEQQARIAELERLVQQLETRGDDQYRLVGDMLDVLATCANSAGKSTQALKLARRAEAIARQYQDDALLAQVTSAVCLPLMDELELEEAHQRWEEGLALARKVGDLSRQARHLQRIPMTLFALGRLEEAATVAAETEDISERAGNRGEVSLAYATQVAVGAVRGDVAEARRFTEKVEECIERSRYVWSGINTMLAWSYAQLASGDTDGAQGTLQRMAQPGVLVTAPDGTSGLERLADRFRDLVYIYAGASERPGSSTGGMASRPPRAPRKPRFSNLGYLCARVQIAALHEQPSVAEGLTDALEQADRCGVILTQGWPFMLARVLGLAFALEGREQPAGEALERALGYAEALGALPEQVHAQLDLAWLQLARGSPTDARRRLRAARHMLEESSLRMPHLHALAERVAKRLRR